MHQRQSPHVAARPGSAPEETRGGDKEAELGTRATDIRSVHQRQSSHAASGPGFAHGETRGGDEEEGVGSEQSEKKAEGPGEDAGGRASLERGEENGSAAGNARTVSADGKGVEEGNLRAEGDGRRENGGRSEEGSTALDGKEDCIRTERECRESLRRKPGVLRFEEAVTYHLIVERVDFSYNIDTDGRVHVYGAELIS